MKLRLATYNIHRCIGLDRRHDPQRVAAVVCSMDADVVALQEVESLPDGGGDLMELLAGQGYEIHSGPTVVRDDGHYGNVLLSRLPAALLHRVDLSVSRRERRGAVVATLCAGGVRILVAATHLGLRRAERRQQVRRLLETVAAEIGTDGPQVRVLLGDLNEWCRFATPIRWLNGFFENGHAPPSFPAWFPVLALDRIMVNPRTILTGATIVNDPLTRKASDHLPVVATLELSESAV